MPSIEQGMISKLIGVPALRIKRVFVFEEAAAFIEIKERRREYAKMDKAH